MIEKSKILIVVPFQSPFIKNDIKIVSSQYNIILNVYNWHNKYLTPIFMILQFFAMLKHIWVIQRIIIEFGGYWSLLPSFFGKLFNIPVLIILHGADCAMMPHINYGSLRKKLIKLSCKISYNFASILLPVSKSLVYIKNDYNTKDIYQGVKHHFPEIKTPFRVISNGLDLEFWKPSKNTFKEDKRFTAVFSEAQFILKGGDLILSLAKIYSDINFYIAGTEKPHGVSKILDNVHFLGKLSQEELREEFRKTTFHFQLAMFEGFGLSLCEAMLCECIPIGSSVNIIPEIIGNTGFILKKKDINQLVKIVDEALLVKDKKELGQKARERIIERYDLNKRHDNLLNAIKTI